MNGKLKHDLIVTSKLLNICDFLRSPIFGLRTSIPSPRETKFKRVPPRTIRIQNFSQWTSFADTRFRQHYFSYKTLIMPFMSLKKSDLSQTVTVIELLEDFVFFFSQTRGLETFHFWCFSVHFGEKFT